MSWGGNSGGGRGGIPVETGGDQCHYSDSYPDCHTQHKEGRLQWQSIPSEINHGLVSPGSSNSCRSTLDTDCPSTLSSAVGQRHLPGYRIDYLGSQRPCRLRRSLQSMGYGVMLCTISWIFLYTLSFSCCVGNSRLEATSVSNQEEYGDENSVVVGMRGGTSHLHDEYHQLRAVERRPDVPSEVHARMVATRRLEEGEDDTPYTLPEENDPTPARSTRVGEVQHRYLFDRPDHDDHRHPGDTRDTVTETGREEVVDNGLNRNNKHNKRVESMGDTLQRLQGASSDNNSGKNRKYGILKPPRRRGHGSNLREPNLDTWTRQGYSRKLPDGLIIGVKKGGTRALLEFLRVHPDIRAPGPEPHFFDRNYEKGLDWYRSMMPPTLDSQLTLEKTPSYFVTKGVPARIFNMSRNMKLIVVVRDPVTRAISDYTQSSSKRMDVKAFDQMAFLDNATGLVDTSWGAIRIGVYAKHLERWLKYFPLTQMHFVSGERLISNPSAELEKVQDFLGLKRVITDKHFYFNSTKGFPCLKKPEGSGNPHCLGKTKGRPHPKVSPKVIKRLHDFYRPFNAKFYQMTCIDFNWH